MRFNAVGLFSLGFFEVWGLCQQAHDHPRLEGGNGALYQRNSATFMQNGHGKFRQKSAYVPAKPWRPITRYAIPYITLYCILYESINNLQFVIKNLCFLSKLLLAWLLGHPLLWPGCDVKVVRAWGCSSETQVRHKCGCHPVSSVISIPWHANRESSVKVLALVL